MGFRIEGLSPEPFAHFGAMDEAALTALGARREIATARPGYPCRVSLDDAEMGETLTLLHFPHLTAANSPYRAAGPIFVRDTAKQAAVDNQLPPFAQTRLLSLRAYDAGFMMIDAEIAEGIAAERWLAAAFARPDVDAVHLHFARRGCFAAAAQRI